MRLPLRGLSPGSIVAAAAAFGFAAATAAASGPAFKVDPISVTLPRGNSSTLVSVVNQGDTKVRFQVTGSAWQQSSAGEMQLEPTQALIFFPTVFTLDAGETRKIRVGVTTPPQNVERTFRLTIQQLPPLEQVIAPTKGVQVNTLLRVSIPVFVEPASQATAGYDITSPTFSNGALHFEYTNTGNTHVLLDGVEVIGKAASGMTLFDYKDRAWYVLAGGRRFWSFALLRPDCEKARSIEISFIAEALKPVEQPMKTFPVDLDCSSAKR